TRSTLGWIPILLLAAGCGLGSGTGPDVQSSAFVFITVDKFEPGSISSNVAQTGVDDTTDVTLRSTPRGLVAPFPLDDVLITSYSVSFSGPGPVPNPFTRPTVIRVPAGTVFNGTISGNVSEPVTIVVVQASDKRNPPLNTISQTFQATATIIFRGTDGRGSEVEATGSLVVVFTPS
ncbi:MAG: hypothetical protein HYY19_09175, partial [Candidatus Rokubacteria bacterium]|nr:hypothetical protein [Candidatus Rokubacteria bacterium]